MPWCNSCRSWYKIQECFGRHYDRHNGSCCQRGPFFDGVEAALDPQDLIARCGFASSTRTICAILLRTSEAWATRASPLDCFGMYFHCPYSIHEEVEMNCSILKCLMHGGKVRPSRVVGNLIVAVIAFSIKWGRIQDCALDTAILCNLGSLSNRPQSDRDQWWSVLIWLDLTTSWLTVGNNSAFADPSAALGLIRNPDQSVGSSVFPVAWPDSQCFSSFYRYCKTS